jgi:hypothetical protein
MHTLVLSNKETSSTTSLGNWRSSNTTNYYLAGNWFKCQLCYIIITEILHFYLNWDRINQPSPTKPLYNIHDHIPHLIWLYTWPDNQITIVYKKKNRYILGLPQTRKSYDSCRQHVCSKCLHHLPRNRSHTLPLACCTLQTWTCISESKYIVQKSHQHSRFLKCLPSALKQQSLKAMGPTACIAEMVHHTHESSDCEEEFLKSVSD